MKKALLLVALLATVGVAQAKDIAYVKNQNNGQIIFTNLYCNGNDERGGLRMYARSGNGQTTYGCWFFNKDSAFIPAVYDDGSRYSYPVNSFIFFDDKK